jgi:multicomponent Na+:H+ antiporter subunit G
MTAREIVVLAFATGGTLLMLISSVGILRLPGVHARMHAVGKAATLGVSGLFLGAGVFFGGQEFWLMIALLVLLFVTAPVATTAMARTAYRWLPHDELQLDYDEMADPQYKYGERRDRTQGQGTP